MRKMLRELLHMCSMLMNMCNGCRTVVRVLCTMYCMTGNIEQGILQMYIGTLQMYNATRHMFLKILHMCKKMQ